MKVANHNWMQLESYLGQDDRAVLPLGSTEQHAFLSLSVDSILSERVALEAAEPLGVPVFPVLTYGLTPYFMAYPGTVSLRLETYLNLIRDILDSLAKTGFKRILLVNGHGGNSPAQAFATEWMADNPEHQGQVSQLVERAQDVSQGARGRHERLARLLDGKLSVDAARGCRASLMKEKAMIDLELLRILNPAGSPRASRGRELWRCLPET